MFTGAIRRFAPLAQRLATPSFFSSTSRGFATSIVRPSVFGGVQSTALRQALSASRSKGFANQSSGLLRRSGARLGVANGEYIFMGISNGVIHIKIRTSACLSLYILSVHAHNIIRIIFIRWTNREASSPRYRPDYDVHLLVPDRLYSLPPQI